MNHPWLAIAEPAPPGFEFRREVVARDLRRAAFALFAESVEQAESVLQPFRGKVFGVIVTLDETSAWDDRGDGIYHLAVPPPLQPHLQGMLGLLLAVLQRTLKLTDADNQKHRDLARAGEDRSRLVREFSGMRDSLLKEIDERRVAQEALQKAHDELEVRVQERTADLAAANESLQEAWKELSRSHDELAIAHQELETDLDLAREFQLALLPRHDPEFSWGGRGEGRTLRLFHFYEPSGSVGGDFFHLLNFCEKKTGIFFCDVMGHGARSALTSAILRGQLEELHHLGPDPGQLLTAINGKFQEVISATGMTMFATAFLIVVDLENLEITCSNAGHPRSLHLKRSQGIVEPLPRHSDPMGPALGLIPNVVFETVRCEANVGDGVIMFTDGIFEVFGLDQEEYGEERFAHAVETMISAPMPELLGAVVERSREFSQKGIFQDDVCLVGIELSGEE